MSTKLPVKLAELILPFLHDKAEAAYLESIQKAVSDATDQATQDLLKSFSRHMAAFKPGDVTNRAEAEPVALSSQRVLRFINAGEYGRLDHQFVIKFRASYPNGEGQLRAAIQAFPPNHALSREEYNAIKARFDLSTRSALLPAMMRALGCSPNRSNLWVTPAAPRQWV